jgi:hypothetical protein
VTPTPTIQWVVAKIGPDGLDREIWTKSGPNLDQIWTKYGHHLDRFLKNGCRNSRQDTAPKYKGIITKNCCKQKVVRDTIRRAQQLHSSTTNKMSRATLPQAALPSLSPWVEQRRHQIMAPPLPNAIRRPRAVGLALAVVGLPAWGAK